MSKYPLVGDEWFCLHDDPLGVHITCNFSVHVLGRDKNDIHQKHWNSAQECPRIKRCLTSSSQRRSCHKKTEVEVTWKHLDTWVSQKFYERSWWLGLCSHVSTQPQDDSKIGDPKPELPAGKRLEAKGSLHSLGIILQPKTLPVLAHQTRNEYLQWPGSSEYENKYRHCWAAISNPTWKVTETMENAAWLVRPTSA